MCDNQEVPVGSVYLMYVGDRRGICQYLVPGSMQAIT